MEKFKNKYRVSSNRLKNWDYSNTGYYFITICTHNRDCNLGQFIDSYDMPFIQLSTFGEIVEQELIKSFKIRKELSLDCYIIMPNHIHLIVILENQYPVETHGRASLHTGGKNKMHRSPKSISSFVAGFKSSVNTQIDNYIDAQKIVMPKYNRYNPFFQNNYHDHIIRNDNELQAIQHYVKYNPAKWNEDVYYS
jgi:REP element-mobilizing transposase RayT